MKKLLFSLLFAVLSLGGVFAYQTFAAEQIDNTPDCDTVAIVRCGSMTEAAVRTNATKGDVPKVYAAFGISQSELNGGFVSGVVWRDGRVTVGSQTVATEALTAGRWNNPKPGMVSIPGTDRAYKMSPSHFVTQGQTAWLKFDSNGKFLFAIIKTCGNPVVAKPVIPKFSCDDLNATRISRTAFRFDARASHNQYVEIVGYRWMFGDGKTGESVQPTVNHTYANPGTYTARVIVKFKLKTMGITRDSTSDACVVKVTVPPAPSYSCDSLKATQISRTAYRFDARASAANGARIAGYKYEFGDGKSGESTQPTVNHTYEQPGTYTARVTATIVVDGKVLRVTSDKCIVKITVNPAPSYSCDSLTASKINRNTYLFTAKGSAANGAVITKYTFNYGDGNTADVTTSATTATSSHAYAAPGTYNATVTLTVKVDGVTKQVTGQKCAVKVTVDQEASYACDELTLTKIDRTKFAFNAKASAAGGATIAKYNFNFGDGQNSDVTTSANTASTEHTYANPGEYTVRVTVYVNVNGQTVPVTSDKCVVKVKVDKQPVYTCDELTAQKISRTQFSFNAKANAENGAVITNYHFDFGDGTGNDVATAAETANTSHTYASPGEYTARVTVRFTVDGQTREVTGPQCTVKVKVEAVPPTYSCDELTFSKVDRTKFDFTAKASANNGATIAKYNFNFGDGQSADVTTAATSASTSHTYAEPGEYTVRTTVSVVVNGQTIPVTSDKCVVKVKVDDKPPTPEFECKSLGAQLINKENRTFKYTLSYTAVGGATLRDVDFNYGDNTPVETFTPAQLGNVTHSYTADGEYTTVATLHFNVNDTVVDRACEVKVNPLNPPQECKPGVPVGHPDCEEQPCPYNPNLPKDSPDCKQLPQVLPATGPGLLGGLVGSSALGYGIYQYAASRRALRDSMKQ